MFSTRLRVMFALTAVLLLVLFARAVQLQWIQREQWEQQAQKGMQQVKLIDTTRGRILDYKGRELAIEQPCIDAVVDYRVIMQPPDARWVREFARARLKSRLGRDYITAPRQNQVQLLDEQINEVRQDINRMWEALGTESLTGANAEQVEDRRQQIMRKVQMQQRYIVLTSFMRAKKQEEEQIPAWWQNWLLEGFSSELTIDSFDVTVGEQVESHVILPAISPEVANYLGKQGDRFPGLSLRPGQHRVYPYAESACHVLGYISAVNGEDLKSDPEPGNGLRKYWPQDEIGRQGIEKLCEPVLRGTRGRWRKEAGRDAVRDEPQVGKDVRLSIDIELQRKIEAAFKSRMMDKTLDTDPLHGAAVVIDVPTGQVRALVSYPTYDLNQLDKLYATMVRDEVNKPLFNRATMSQLEPGSTVKPMVGLAGITEGVVGIHEGIECTGFLRLGGTTFKDGKCWTASVKRVNGAHHQTPPYDPHHGKFGNPDGFLVYSDALKRSCNVWPETVADRLGWEKLQAWYERFGLFRPTGVGISESSGRMPDMSLTQQRRSKTWFAAIGQGIGATPIQMANVAATIARNGIWSRPNLIADGFAASPDEQQRVDLHLSRQALQEAKAGMSEAVNQIGGTAHQIHRTDVEIAGKSGTAQAQKFSVVVRDDKGEPVKVNGVIQRHLLEPSIPGRRNAEAPWYRAGGEDGSELDHAWIIGFAPADKPQIAFAVMVEYGGGSGGKIGGAIGQALLAAAIEEGYLPVSGKLHD